jgi:CheY-like chemotaxis protein
VRTIILQDGLQAQAWIHAHPPDLIILDYLLPGMNGLTLYDALRREEVGATIPIIMTSANLSQKERDERNLLFLPKPFELDAFLSLVESQLVFMPLVEYTPTKEEKVKEMQEALF